MNKIIGILLIGFLGFLGCSDGDDGTGAVTAVAIPLAPFGITDTTTPTYEWIPVPGATRYLLLVEDIDRALVIEDWYTAEEGGCALGEGLCMVTPDIKVTGEYTWKIQSYGSQEGGLWSDELQFRGPSFSYTTRFTDHGDGTVTDNKTELMWTRDAFPYKPNYKNWHQSASYCGSKTYANVHSWRLPFIQEVWAMNHLPTGHPFVNVANGSNYWSATPGQVHDPMHPDDPGEESGMYAIEFGPGGGFPQPRSLGLGGVVWCVRP